VLHVANAKYVSVLVASAVNAKLESVIVQNNVPFYIDEWDEKLYTIIYGWEEANFEKFLKLEMPDYLI
jgi:hypothetical protein